VPVQLRCAVPKKLMACLEASSASGEVKELPLWLAKGLNTAGFVDPSFPTAYKERSLQKMKAGASSVQLGQRYPYFYLLGTEMALLDNTQKGYEVLETLQEAFAMRYKEILDRFHNTGEVILETHAPTLRAVLPFPFLMLCASWPPASLPSPLQHGAASCHKTLLPPALTARTRP